MDDASRASYAKLEASLAAMPAEIGATPAAVLMISAHWEEPQFTLTSNPQPPMVYDYYGFPDFTYQIHYDAPGDPALAARVKALIESAGLPARLDGERGFDHGAFTPLKVIYPRANVPVVQLSLREGLDPDTHLALGRAIAPLRDEGVLIIGSGLSYHNLRQFFSPRAWGPSREFDGWLNGVSDGRQPAGPLQTIDRLGGRSRGPRGTSARRTPAAADGGRGRRGRRCGATDISRSKFPRRTLRQ